MILSTTILFAFVSSALSESTAEPSGTASVAPPNTNFNYTYFRYVETAYRTRRDCLEGVNGEVSQTALHVGCQPMPFDDGFLYVACDHFSDGNLTFEFYERSGCIGYAEKTVVQRSQ